MRYGYTAIQYVVKTSNLDIIDMRLGADADLNSPPHRNHGVTAIQLAAEKGISALSTSCLKEAQMSTIRQLVWRHRRLANRSSPRTLGVARRLLDVDAKIRLKCFMRRRIMTTI